MATTKAKVSKSAKIREALKATPNKSATELAKEIGVTPALVYNIKAKLGGKRSRKGKRRSTRANGRAKVIAPHGAHAALDSAFEFVSKVGGLLHAEQLIDRLKSIKDKL